MAGVGAESISAPVSLADMESANMDRGRIWTEGGYGIRPYLAICIKNACHFAYD